MDLSKELSLFMARERGGEREGECGSKHFATYSHGEARRGEDFFFNALFLTVFGERDFTCIRTVVGPQQSHKGMLNIARIVTGARKGTSHDLIYNELDWPTLADRRKGVKLKNFFKIINNETPEFLRSLLPKRIGDVRPQSRNPDNYYTVKARTETFR